MSVRTRHRPTPATPGRAGAAITASLALLALSGCSLFPGESAPADAAPAATETSEPTPQFPVVPGYDVGEFPPVPLLVLPDLRLLTSAQAGFAVDIAQDIGEYPGLTVEPASCDESGAVQSSNGSTILYGDGSGAVTGPDGQVVNYGDGSGVVSTPDMQVVNYGDGSGTVTTADTQIVTYGDGTGSYNGPGVSVNVLGGGAGNRTAGDESLVLFGDGSGNYTKGGVSIVNHGDGSGNYSDGTLQIINYGDGTGLIDGVPYDGFEKIEPAPSVGAFPTMGAVAPIESCGIIISLESEVLFDFDRAEVRADAAEVLQSLSRALTENSVPAAEIGGHTDSIGDPAYNLDLSERRAAAVVAALQANGTTSTLDAVGYGDTRPVAPNANEDGSDNPAGRQENRRVEVFVPAFT